MNNNISVWKELQRYYALWKAGSALYEKWSNEHKNSFTINKGSSHSLELYLDNNDILYETIAIKKSDMDKIYTSITFNSYYEAPLASNSIIGSLSIFVNDRLYFKTDILNYNEIPKKDILDYFSNLISNYSSYL